MIRKSYYKNHLRYYKDPDVFCSIQLNIAQVLVHNINARYSVRKLNVYVQNSFIGRRQPAATYHRSTEQFQYYSNNLNVIHWQLLSCIINKFDYVCTLSWYENIRKWHKYSTEIVICKYIYLFNFSIDFMI